MRKDYIDNRINFFCNVDASAAYVKALIFI